ncbi:unnamed protein product [Cuscuta campestris]|uniref:Uncharacterized protein n=1 Tax=Cuscuta campestris TaxID=132261 RepID=A0A484M9A4_9ASTE|nr:unnamed protein product [Cuscuta campestris]
MDVGISKAPWRIMVFLEYPWLTLKGRDIFPNATISRMATNAVATIPEPRVKEKARAEKLEQRRKEKEAQLALEKQHLVQEDFKIMTTDVENLPPREHAVVLMMKDKITLRWLAGEKGKHFHGREKERKGKVKADVTLSWKKGKRGKKGTPMA